MSEYTAEEYREVLNAIYDMNSVERKNIFGVSMLVGGYAKEFSVSELIEKYRAYVTPKVGEYWKSNSERNMVIVRYIKDGFVYYYYCSDGLSSYMQFDVFVKNFTKTECKSRYLHLLLEEMEEVSK